MIWSRLWFFTTLGLSHGTSCFTIYSLFLYNSKSFFVKQTSWYVQVLKGRWYFIITRCCIRFSNGGLLKLAVPFLEQIFIATSFDYILFNIFFSFISLIAFQLGLDWDVMLFVSTSFICIATSSLSKVPYSSLSFSFAP